MLWHVGPPDQNEAARRVRAAAAFAGVDQKDLYEALGIDRTTFARRIGKKGNDRAGGFTWDQLADIARVCDVPWAWFVADLTRLEELVPEDAPSFPKPRSPAKIVAAATRRDDGSSGSSREDRGPR